MKPKFRNKYKTESIRLQNWDYSGEGAYFITICTKDRIHSFGEISAGIMQLSQTGVLADVFWHEIKHHAKHVQTGPFVVMPNHIHGILIIDKNIGADGGDKNADDVDTDDIVETRHALSLHEQQTNPNKQSNPETPPNPIGKQRFGNQGKNTVSSIIGSYKSAVTKHAHRLGFDFAWQPGFYENIIRNPESYDRIAEYIINNPLRWQDDKFHS